jgi:FAD:protein FMN transferase
MSTGVSFPAIGTTAHLLVSEPDALAAAERLLRDFLADLDTACSRFRPDSALSTVNRRRSVSGVHPVLLAALEVALRAARDTDGLVDPTLGHAMIAIGYDRRFADVPPSSRQPVTPVPTEAVACDAFPARHGRPGAGVPQDTEAVACDAFPARHGRPGAGVPQNIDQSWRQISVDQVTGSVSLPPGAQLDLGATAKAWAADVAAEQIAALLGCGVLVNLGGDLSIGGEPPAGGWQIRVTADHAVPTGGQVVALRSGGLATSSTMVRAWRCADQVLHHVLDPATGLPARRVWGYVSVAGPDCVTANTAATAAIVLGQRAPGWLAERDLAARLVAPDGTVTTVAGWPGDPEMSTVEVA